MEEKTSFKDRFMKGFKNISNKFKESLAPVNQDILNEIVFEIRSFPERKVFTFNEILENHNIKNHANKMDYISNLLELLENDIEEVESDSFSMLFDKKYVKKIKVEIIVE